MRLSLILVFIGILLMVGPVTFGQDATKTIGNGLTRVNTTVDMMYATFGTFVQLAGLIVSFKGVMKFIESSGEQNTQDGLRTTAAKYFFAGVLMIILPTYMGIGVNTFFGDNTSDIRGKNKLSDIKF